MTLREVKVKSIDERSPFVYSSRTMEIVMSGGRITTPTRAATLSEYNYKNNIPSEIVIDNPISLSIRTLNRAKLCELLQDNKPYSKLSERMEICDQSMRYSPLRVHIIQPTATDTIVNNNGKRLRMNSGIEYLSENTKERERFLRFNIQLQVDLGLDLISIPYLRLPLNSYCQLVEDIARNLRKQNREPFIIFDLGYGKAEKFSDALSFFIKKVNISIIGFNYKSFTNHAVSYDVLSQYIDKDVAFVMLNTERLDIINNQISTMHYMPFLGNDVFAVKTPQFRGGSDPFAATKQKLSSMKLIKFFNPSNLIIEPAMLRVNKPRELLNEIHESSNMRLFDILSDYDAENKDEDEYRVPVLRSLSKVHELKSSTKEFGELQKRVKSSEASDYVREKRYLESCLTNLRRTRTTHK